MTAWMRDRATRFGAEDAKPDERTAAVVGDDRYCDTCPGTRAHTRDCPTYLEIRRQMAEDQERRRREEARDMAAFERAKLMATRKGRASL